MPNGSRKNAPCTVVLLGWQAAEKLSETGKVPMLAGPPRAAEAGNDCVSLANYNDQPRH
jgi:hypothetical protein